MDILLGKSSDELTPISLNLEMGNRHGLISGATGTGKTVTLQTLAELFSKAGSSVFAADVKGDLSGISKPAILNDKLKARIEKLKIDSFRSAASPVIFWDLFGEKGIPVRTTLSEVGPLILSRILELNDTQSEVLQMIYKMADDEGLLLLDLKDLQSALDWVSENATQLKSKYGNISTSTIGTIQRGVVNLTDRGGKNFFGEPALKLQHFLQQDLSGRGVVNILDGTKLLQDPLLYSSFLLWLLSELFEELPEVGDLDIPKLVFFFDEAHLLFTDTPPSLLTKIEQVVRLIRSKGVGIYFVTQNPSDIPESVLAQLGNRIQHALRAYTPKEQKAVRSAAESFRPNPAFKTENVISELQVGEALVSLLDSEGRPNIVQRVLIAPPESRIGPITPEERKEILSRSQLLPIYENPIDRESAFEVLKERKNASKDEEKPFMEKARLPKESNRQSFGEAMMKSFVRSIATQLGRSISRGVLGSKSRR